MIAVRLTSEQKERLEQLASQRNQTISDVIRGWIDGDGIMDGIPGDLMQRIKAEAQRRGITASDLIIKKLVPVAFDKLRKTGSTNVFVLE
jgi:hypothetical protein